MLMTDMETPAPTKGITLRFLVVLGAVSVNLPLVHQIRGIFIRQKTIIPSDYSKILEQFESVCIDKTEFQYVHLGEFNQ